MILPNKAFSHKTLEIRFQNIELFSFGHYLPPLLVSAISFSSSKFYNLFVTMVTDSFPWEEIFL